MNNEEKMIAELMELGFSPKHKERKFLLYEAQLWLMTKGFHIAPRIYLYHDINLDEQTSWGMHRLCGMGSHLYGRKEPDIPRCFGSRNK